MGRNVSKEPAAVVLITLLAIGAIAPPSAQAVAPRPAPSPEAIDSLVGDWMRANAVPGLALAITQGTSVMDLRGYGDAGDGPVTPDTQFLVASLSKSFTALAVLQLVEAGRIELDAPIRTYLPEFTVADTAAAERITVRMLLNQTSGMADAGFPELTLPQPGTIAERVGSLRDAKLVDEPGAAFHYFNPNYAVLARLVEVIAGRPFPEYLRDHVFAPLGMTKTTSVATSGEAASAALLAQGHILAFGVPIAREEPDGYLGGSGGVISTARDLANWLIMQNGRGVFGTHSLLSARGMELMHTPPAGIDSSYAMGWTRRPGTPVVLEQTGVLSTFYAEQALLPDDRVGIAFLASAYNGFVDFEGFMGGLIALVTGERNPGVGFGARRIGIVLGAVAALVAAAGLWRILRVRSWAGRRRGQPWRTALGVGVPFVPAVVTALTPSLVARFSARVFGWRLLVLAFPDVMVCLILAGAAGAMLGILRWISMVRRAGASG